MSKLRALELAVSLHIAKEFTSTVLQTAQEFADFIGGGEETPQVIGGVTGKPRKAATKPAAAPTEPVADPETPAANEPVAAAEPVKAAVVQTPAPAAVAPANPLAPSGVTLDEIKKTVGALAVNAAAGGAVKVRAILGTFEGATNISTLKPIHYAAAKKAIEEVLEAAALVA